MVKVLLSNIGGLNNIGIVMMVRAIQQNVDAEFYYHRLTVCRDYEQLGIAPSFKPYGFDLALDLGGDTFTIYYGVLQFLRHCFHLFVLWLFRQPYVIFGQTLSNYGVVTSRLTGFFLRRAKLVTLRDRRSMAVAQRLGVKAVLTADVAWVVEGIPSCDYRGSSYHRLILAAINGRSFQWSGERADNFKFDIFHSAIDMEELKKDARENFRLLQGILEGR